MRRYLMEAIGTFVLILAIGLTNDPFAKGMILIALIAGGMQISGAHFNPAVSFAYYLRKKISFSALIGYSTSQILGTFAAAGILLTISGSVFYIQPPTSTNLFQQVVLEITFTFTLVLAYLSFINMGGGKIIKIHAVGIGLVFVGITIIGENISGAVYNPALSIGSSIVDFITVRGASFEFIPLYTVAPITGSALAALLYKYLYD